MQLTQTKYFRSGAVLLVLLFMVLYAATLDNGLQPYELHGGDLITHQYAQVQARPGNAPGYPLYTMGGWLWFHGLRSVLQAVSSDLPNPSPVLSSYSTLWGLLALALFYANFGNLAGVTRRPTLATLVCFLVTTYLGLTYFFWYYATTTEQYSSAIAHTLAIVYVYLRWDAQPQRRGLVLLLAFLCGLALAHMLTVALIVPPLVGVMLWRAPRILIRPRMIAEAVLVALLPLLSYLYVYARGALHPEWWGRGDWGSPQAWFWSFVSTAQGREELLWALEPGRSWIGNGFPELIWHELSVPLLILGLVGIGLMAPHRSVLFFGTLVLYLGFSWAYRFGNWFQVILPAYPLVLLGLAPLFAHIESRCELRASTSQRKTALILLALYPLALASLVVWRGAESLPRADSRYRNEDTAMQHAGVLIAQNLPKDAAVFAAVDDALALDYVTAIWGIRTDIRVVSSKEANQLLASGTDVYSTWDAVPTLLDELSVDTRLNSATADWVQVAPPLAEMAPYTPTSSAAISITSEIQLVDIHTKVAPTDPLVQSAPDGLDVMLLWRLPSGTWPDGVAISVRPLNDGEPMVNLHTGEPIQQDRNRPIRGLWQPPSTVTQTLVADAYRLAIPEGELGEVDCVLIIVYVQDTAGAFTNLAEIRHAITSP